MFPSKQMLHDKIPTTLEILLQETDWKMASEQKLPTGDLEVDGSVEPKPELHQSRSTEKIVPVPPKTPEIGKEQLYEQRTCSAPLLAEGPNLSQFNISILRKESSAHKVYGAYDNKRRAWYGK